MATGLGSLNQPPAGHLRETVDFGPNPGNLRMLSYVPDTLADAPGLVVVLHGCTQNAAGYDHGTGWSDLAARSGFALLLPEQQRANNPNTCFNWFVPHHTQRGSGEAQSIRSMIETMIREHGIDRRRVFITGLSAGGAMAAAMLSTYPEVFAGGAIIAGLPYHAATDVPGAFQSMSQGRVLTALQQGDLVRAASDHRGPWPKVSVWHGTADTTVHPVNAAELLKQWTNVHGLSLAPSEQDRVDGQVHRTWRNGDGDAVVEEFAVAGMAHGTPLATGEGENQYGRAGPYLLEVGISSTYHIARFWGLTDAAAANSEVNRETHQERPADRVVGHRVEVSTSPAPEQPANSNRVDPGRFNVRVVIENALKSAGLMK
jgi:feruloyl esterase